MRLLWQSYFYAPFHEYIAALERNYYLSIKRRNEDMFQNLIRSITDDTADNLMERMLKDTYSENLFVMVTAAQKLKLRSIIEASLRGETGKVLARSYGSPNVQSPWEKVFLNPVQLFKLPTESTKDISMNVIIGKNAKKPLNLATPIMITGMSYGASLHLNAKIALAKGAAAVGTATNTGESSVSDEEREAAHYLIGQYNRYNILRDHEDLSKLDAIEIQFGQGAWGGAIEKTISSDQIGDHLRETWKLGEGQDAFRTARFPNENSESDIINIINELKGEYDIPVGVKIAATHYIEKELDVILKTNADFIAIDGAEGGTAGSPPTLQDDLGLPTIYAISRAAKYLQEKGASSKYDLIAAGGLKTPGDFLKALALGAKAVYIGSIALVAMLGAQSTKATPAEPTPQLVLYDGKLQDDFDIDEGSRTLANFLNSCNEEMKLALLAMGKRSIGELSKEDLVATEKDLSECLNVGYAGCPGNK